MKHLVMILLMGLSCMSNVSYGGNGDLTVGGTLEMTSNANGFLPPRMSTSAKGNLSPSPGMLIYNTDDNAYNYYTSSGWKAIPASLPVHDNTGASADYALAVGETAKITFTSATSVPLHIAMEQGEYEVSINCSIASPAYSAGGIWLKPNNNLYSGACDLVVTYTDINRNGGYAVVSAGGYGSGLDSSLFLGDNFLLRATLRISTFTTAKALAAKGLEYLDANTTRSFTAENSWADTSTLWTSLGSISFPNAQSGTIIIRRIL